MTVATPYLPPLKNDLLLRVAHQLPVPRVPVWMMRQAGRTDPLYRQLREEDGRPLEEVFLDPEVSIQASLLPKRLGVDAIIMFQDILTPLTPMGTHFKFAPGPVIPSPIQHLDQVLALKEVKPEKSLTVVGHILKGISDELQGELPILGFAGAPVTLAFFMIAGKSPGKDQYSILEFMASHEEFTTALLKRLTTLTIDYLNYQIESGAHAVQLFESFAEVIPRAFYERFVQPTHEAIFSALPKNTPKILFAKECSFMDLMIQSGASIYSVGSCVNLKETLDASREPLIFQGNVDNQIVCNGTKENITSAIKACYAQTQKRNHIMNLNHGLLSQTPFENVQHFVNEAIALGQITEAQ
ncbi:uroporphyrinogen decarboxylase family protein [Deltaproteobacteria bacterium TL4]